MTKLLLHDFHDGRGAHFATVNEAEVVDHYQDTLAEYTALQETAGVVDLSFRSRVCVTGADRVRFLHGQVTNDITGLVTGSGCYAAITTTKGKMEADLNIYRLAEELLLDFEPGLTKNVSDRLEKYIVADDVQVVDIGPLYGLLSVQGPESASVAIAAGLAQEFPQKQLAFVKVQECAAGEVYLMNQPRLGTSGFDLFMPIGQIGDYMDKLVASAKAIGGRLCGWRAVEMARIEGGIPRFGVDMDESNFPQECGIESRAVSYTKGCYIGQEILNRIHTLGHVNRELTGLRLADGLKDLPVKGTRLFHAGKEAGYTTSALASPKLGANVALGYVRKELNQIGKEVMLRCEEEESRAQVVPVPFLKKPAA